MSMERLVEHTLSEHLKCYILLAYDYDGQHLTISKIRNQEEMDALHNAIARKEIEFASNLSIGIDEDDNEFEIFVEGSWSDRGELK